MTDARQPADRHVVIGAGPAGLMAAWELTRRGQDVVVLEADPDYVGGLARTVVHDGYRFDLGGHRFYTKSEEIERLWGALLPGEFLDVKRQSRICFEGAFLSYPIELGETLRHLGLRRSLGVLASYLRARLRPRRPEQSFEDWAINRFGRRLYALFFETYTEKVWNVRCAEMSRDWATQRIRGLSLGEAVRNALTARSNGQAKSLITSFRYPRLGPGQLWEAVRDVVVDRGNRVELGCEVVRLHRRGRRVESVETRGGEPFEGSQFYATMTLQRLVRAMSPPPPDEVLAAADRLRYRDFLVVALIVDRADLFGDQWIYVHDPGVRVARIQNYGNWSRDLVPHPGTTCLGMEYFCSRDDPVWDVPDPELLALASRELEQLGLGRGAEVRGGHVVRVRDAYPVYDERYRERRETIRRWLAENLDNLYPAGRGGLHNYNSQDHAMMSGLLSVENACEGAAHDVWSINTEQEYAEDGRPGVGRVPRVPARDGVAQG